MDGRSDPACVKSRVVSMWAGAMWVEVREDRDRDSPWFEVSIYVPIGCLNYHEARNLRNLPMSPMVPPSSSTPGQMKKERRRKKNDKPVSAERSRGSKGM